MLSREERTELEADYKVEPILGEPIDLMRSTPAVSDGSATDFYDIIGCKDVDDLAEHWNLKGDEFNCLKAIAGIALGSRHPGTDPKRDANKLVHYANRIKNRLDK